MRYLLLATVTLCAVAACRGPHSAPASDSPGAPGASATSAGVGNDPGGVGRGTPLVAKPGRALASFAAGCFWGVEDGFRHVRGVTATAVGYTGGHTEDPSYAAVCDHNTGHAEAVLVEYDPKVVSYEKLCDIFFKMHDPTQLNQQGPDVGDQYRSEIFTLDPAQMTAAKASLTRAQPANGGKIATKIEPLGKFWKAEEYHQQYAEKTGSHGCPITLPPEAT